VKRLRVLFADDHEPLHAVIRRLVEPEFELVSAVVDGLSLVNAAHQHHPEVMIVDIAMPEMNGIQAVREILRSIAKPAPAVVFLTTYNEQSLVEQALEIGAVGYVLKESAADHLLPALRAVLNGDSYLSPGVVSTAH
jgi:DNA-binding NarL/FixJ family response regulator